MSLHLEKDLSKIEELSNLKTLYERDSKGNTPLHTQKNGFIIKAMLNKLPIDKDETAFILMSLNKYGDSILHTQKDVFAFEEILKKLQQVLEYRKTLNVKDFVNWKNNFNATPLHKQKDGLIVEMLLDNGAEIDGQDKHQNRVLHYSKDLYATKLLIKKWKEKYGSGINFFIDFKNKNNETPLFKQKDPQVIRELIKNYEGEVEYYVNYKDKNGNTPLHISNDKVRIELIKAGADPNIQFDNGNSLLHVCSNKELAKLLIEKGCNVNIRNNCGCTPLHLQPGKSSECTEDELGVIDLLLENGAYVNKIDFNGDTPLHFPKECRIIKKIIEHTKGDIIVINNRLETPLHCQDNVESMKELLNVFKQNINSKDIDGNIPLHIHQNNEKIVRLLLLSGADVFIKNKKGETPYQNGIVRKEYFKQIREKDCIERVGLYLYTIKRSLFG